MPDATCLIFDVYIVAICSNVEYVGKKSIDMCCHGSTSLCHEVFSVSFDAF